MIISKYTISELVNVNIFYWKHYGYNIYLLSLFDRAFENDIISVITSFYSLQITFVLFLQEETQLVNLYKGLVQ